TTLLGCKYGEQQSALRPSGSASEYARQLHYSGRAGAVIVRARKNGSLRSAVVVIVSAEHDRLFPQLRVAALEHPDHVSRPRAPARSIYDTQLDLFIRQGTRLRLARAIDRGLQLTGPSQQRGRNRIGDRNERDCDFTVGERLRQDASVSRPA